VIVLDPTCRGGAGRSAPLFAGDGASCAPPPPGSAAMKDAAGESAPRGSAAAPALSARAPRLAVVVPSLHLGGAERVACALARKWQQAGNEVSLVTYFPTSVDRLSPPPGVGRIALVEAGKSRNVVEGVIQATRRVLAVRRAFARLRPDVVISFLERTNVVALLAAMGSGVPVFVCERTDPRRQHIEPHWSVLRRFVYPRAAGVVVQTESVARWARAFCSRVYVIPNFVECPARPADPGSDTGPLTLVALGRLSAEKGFDTLVRAFARVAGSHPRWSLVIFGEGPERDRLAALATQLGVSGRVSLPGRTDHPEVELAAAHAFALPSRFEGFPNALLEAMACGLPAVAFDCRSGPRDIIVDGENGILVADGDADAFSAALARVMTSAPERRRLGRNARQSMDRFAPRPILDRWSALLRAGLERR